MTLLFFMNRHIYTVKANKSKNEVGRRTVVFESTLCMYHSNSESVGSPAGL